MRHAFRTARTATSDGQRDLKVGPESTLEDIAFIVCSELNKVGTSVVLTGGAAATLWSKTEYQSRDCDFVLMFTKSHQAALGALTKISFTEHNGMYKHPQTIFTVDFLPGPLSIGREIITSWHTLNRGEYLLNILTPTDACRDRLAAFYHWNDFSALKTAVVLAKRNQLDYGVIEKWSEVEESMGKYHMFKSMIDSSGIHRD